MQYPFPPPPTLGEAAALAATNPATVPAILEDPTMGLLIPVHVHGACHPRRVWPDAHPDYEDSLPRGMETTGAACPNTTVGWVLVTTSSSAHDDPDAWIGWAESYARGRQHRLAAGPGELTVALYHVPTLAGPQPIVWRGRVQGPVYVRHPSTGEPTAASISVAFKPHRIDPALIPFPVRSACSEQVSR